MAALSGQHSLQFEKRDPKSMFSSREPFSFTWDDCEKKEVQKIRYFSSEGKGDYAATVEYQIVALKIRGYACKFFIEIENADTELAVKSLADSINRMSLEDYQKFKCVVKKLSESEKMISSLDLRGYISGFFLG